MSSSKGCCRTGRALSGRPEKMEKVWEDTTVETRIEASQIGLSAQEAELYLRAFMHKLRRPATANSPNERRRRPWGRGASDGRARFPLASRAGYD